MKKFDITFIKDPDAWPWWPILPVKLRGAGFDNSQFCGIIHAMNLTRVYFTNMYALAAAFREANSEEVLSGLEFRDYPTVEALVNEYMVD